MTNLDLLVNPLDFSVSDSRYLKLDWSNQLAADVSIQHKDGKWTYYQASADTDIARGTVLRTAVAASTAGDDIFLKGISYDIGNNTIRLPDDVDLYGSGIDSTFILSQADLTTKGVIVVPGNYSYVEKLTIQANGGNIYQACIGFNTAAGDTVAANVTIHQVKTIGDTDSWYFYSNSATVPYWRIWDSICFSKYDGVSFFGGQAGNFDLYNFEIKVTGPSWTNQGGSGLNTYNSNNAVIVRMFGGSIKVSGHTAENIGVRLEVSSPMQCYSTFELYNVNIETSGNGAMDIQLNSDPDGDNTGTIKISNVRYEPTKTSIGNGHFYLIDNNATLASVKDVDGAGSGLDADLLDGQHGSYYAAATDYLKLNQTTPQTVTGGPPVFSEGLKVSADKIIYLNTAAGTSTAGLYADASGNVSIFGGAGSLGLITLDGYKIVLNGAVQGTEISGNLKLTAMSSAGFVKNSAAGLFSGGNSITIGDIGALLSKTDPITYNSGTGEIGLGYNATNLQVTATQLNTIQDIATTSSPTFFNLVVNGTTPTALILDRTVASAGVTASIPVMISASLTLTGTKNLNPFYANIFSFTDQRVITSTSTAEDRILNFGVTYDSTYATESSFHTARIFYINAGDNGTYGTTQSGLGRSAARNGLDITLTGIQSITGNKNITYSKRGVSINVPHSDPIVLAGWTGAGTYTANIYGVEVVGGQGTYGTTKFSAFRCATSSGADTSYALENVGSGGVSPNNFMGQDNSISYFGTGADFGLSFDGSNALIRSDYITSTDTLTLRAGTNGMAFNIGATQQLILTSAKLNPTSDNTLDLGDSTHGLKALYLTKNNSTDVSAEAEVRYDSNNQGLTSFLGGIKQVLHGAIFVQTADVTVANTVAATSLIGSGVGTVTLPANFFVAGKTVRIQLRGFYSTTGNPTGDIDIKYGSTSIVTLSASQVGNNVANHEFSIWITFTCRTTGSSGTIIGQSEAHFFSTHGTSTSFDIEMTTPTTINTTTSNALDVVWTWGTGDPANTITATNCIVEVIS